MFNILPEIFRKGIKTDYQLRRLLIILIFVFIVQFSFLVFIFPSWITSYNKEKDITSQMEEINKSSSYQDADPVYSTIESTNFKLKIINTNLQYFNIVPLIKLILSNKIPGVSVGELSFVSSGAKSSTISLKGISVSRDLLILYKDALEKTKVFSRVDLPISNLAKDKNLIFTIDLTVSQ